MSAPAKREHATGAPGRFNAQTFAPALLNPESGTPSGLNAWNGSDPAARLDVYRNNVVHSLTQALATSFDVVRQLIGDECFRATAAFFIRQHPPCSPILAEYGAQFPDFLDHFEPLATLPYLPDVARLEYLRIQAFHAADAEALTHGALAALNSDPAALLNARLTLHPSVGLLCSGWAITSIWSAHQGPQAPQCTDITHAEAALILRADDDTAVIHIPHASAHFVEGLRQGRTLGESAQAALGQSFPDQIAFDFASTLGLLLHHQALTAPIEQDTAS